MNNLLDSTLGMEGDNKTIIIINRNHELSARWLFGMGPLIRKLKFE